MSSLPGVVVAAVIGLSAVPVLAGAKPPEYPKAERQDIVETLHGVPVSDPYRWLEEPAETDAVQTWIKAQNALTFEYLTAVPQREKIKQRITELWNYEKWGIPYKEGGRYFVTRNNGLQNQSPLYVMDTLTSEPRLLLDPNTLRSDGTVALAGTAVSEDGRYLAYGIAEAGSDWNSWKVREVATGKDLSDELKWVKFSGASWMKDGSGFFYSRYDAPKEGQALTGSNYYPKVYFHKVGTSQDADVLVYDRADQKEWGLGAFVTEDGRYLCMTLSQGTDPKNRFYVRDLSTAPLTPPDGGVKVKIGEFSWTVGGEKRVISAAPTVLATPQDAEIWATEFAARCEQELLDTASDDAARAKHAKTLEEQRAKRAQLVAANKNMSRGFVELLNDYDASYDFVGNDGPVFYFVTDLEASRRRVIAIDITRPERANWTTVIPEAAETLQGVSYVGGHLLASYLKDAKTAVKVYTTAGKAVRDVDLPGIGTASGFGGKQNQSETFYAFSGFTTPTSIFRYDVTSGKSEVFRKPTVKFNPEDYTTEQVFYTSKDGTRVPMFISYKKGMKRDGNAPTLLYGYGGFNIPLTPGFSPANLAWMEMGGVYAVANLRGGGEYGKAWHDAGRLANKQNVFDDFISAAEYLIRQKYTSTPKLAIHGGSNGGLLVGACMVQRPELFGAALPAVGVLDMLRFHKFTIGWAWTSDYGSPDDPKAFETLMKYSPYHNVKPAKYPKTMILTGDHDDRVVPAHSFKFAAALQNAQQGDNPILVRIDVRAGHGAGKPTDKVIEQAADQWSFLVRALDMPVE
jgi:prolyl oligopeptidase